MAEKPELKLWNTLTRKKEVFQPIDPQNVRMYVCGPTVYDFAHIGNARPVIVFDVLNRLLRHLYGESHVTYVRNITDVDDKINARALRDFGAEITAGTMTLNDAIRRVTETTANQFQADVKALGCREPDHKPRATEHIDGMIAMAQALIDKGHAYVAEGREGREVLFDVSSMPAYGKLSNRRIEDQQAGARIDVKDHKRNPGDFVLWKQSEAHEPGWHAHFHVPLHAEGPQSGVSKHAHIDIFGRPGWHIECSVMSRAHLGDVFDIHGGGLDLIFPHHENEIAQSCCANGTEVMANYWMHNGFLQLEGKKMSKSDGNFVTISELLNTTKFGGRKWPGEVLRLAMLMTHYREPIDFSVSKLTEASRMVDEFNKQMEKINLDEIEYPNDDEVWSSHGVVAPSLEISEMLKNDLNTVAIIGLLRRHIDESNGKYGSFLVGHGIMSLYNDLKLLGFEFRGYRKKVSEMLGGFAFDKSADSLRKAKIEEIVFERLAHLAAKNFAEADRIRNELAAQGIQLMDYKDAETGERRTKWEVKR